MHVVVPESVKRKTNLVFGEVDEDKTKIVELRSASPGRERKAEHGQRLEEGIVTS